jgi:hypothetical protein
MERRYSALRTIATIYKVAGIIVLIITIISILGICATSVLGGSMFNRLSSQYGNFPSPGGTIGGILGGLIASLVSILTGGGLALTLYATGEGIYLLLAMEENTRATTVLLQRQLNPPGA